MSNLSELTQKHKELLEKVSELESLIVLKLNSFKAEQLPLSVEDLDNLLQLLSIHKEDNGDSVWNEFSMVNYYSLSFVEYLTEWILSKETFVPDEVEKYLKICNFATIELHKFIEWYGLYPKRFKELYNFICNHKDGACRVYAEGWLLLIEKVLQPKLKIPTLGAKVIYETDYAYLKSVIPSHYRSYSKNGGDLSFLTVFDAPHHSCRSYQTLKLSELLSLKTYE